MKLATRFALVLVTAPSLKEARRLALIILRERLAACANLIPRLESHYWWKGKLEQNAEILILFKTDRRRLARLEERVLANHPYKTPEIVAVPLNRGTAGYLAWLSSSLNGDK